MPVTNESAYLPFESSPLPNGSWLVLAPHPDDETFGMGGTLLLAKAQGIAVDLIFVTGGGKGGKNQENLLKIRELEAQKVADKLGVRKVYFWCEVDRELTASQHLIDKLSAFIEQWQPATVFFPGPSEPHPDHRTTAILAWESLRSIGFPATPMSYDISVQGYTNYLIDITQLVDDKRLLMNDYKSQLTENRYIDRIIALNKARTWSLPESVSYAESFYLWPKENRPLNALVLSLAAKESSLHALPDSLPLISVITRTQNRPEFLREAIRSVAGQTYPNIELIVINDGGQDCRSLVKEEAIGNIQQCHYEYIATNLGRSAAANLGLKYSHGEFIIFLDDDDFFEAHHINSLYEHLRVHKESIAAYSAVRCIDKNGKTINTFAEEFDPIQLYIDNFIPIHSVLFKYNDLSKTCLFDENLELCEDWDFWIQLLQQGNFSFLPTIGANYRIHNIGSGLWDNAAKSKPSALKVYKKWLPRWDEDTLWSIFEYAHYKKKVTEQETVIAEKNNLITEQESVIAEKTKALFHQNELLLNNKQVHFDLNTEIEKLNNAILLLEQEKQSLYVSHSWQITRPLRNIKSLVTGNKNTMRQLAYLVWSRLPLNVHQRIRIKAKLVKKLPILNNLLGLSPIPDTKIEWQDTEELTKKAPTNNTTQYSDEYYIRLDAAINSTPLDYVPLAGDHIDGARTTVKVIAFYLPQFHPVPVNDKEWGRGFTEWTNVSKAIPQFVGHYQPRLPGELGYYDLRLKEVQQRQIELAKQYGIDGFCYHHYWFGGTKVLEKPFQQILDDPSLDLPFCLCWANENWTRRWDGSEDEVILAQQHSPEDDIAFIADITPALKDKRYIRINNKPLLIVYRPDLLPDPAATAARWRKYAIEAGIGDLHIVSAATFGFEDFESIHYDGLVQFPPHNIGASNITAETTLLNPDYMGHVFDYKEFSMNAMKALAGQQHTFPCVMMNWDNEARKPGKGHTFYGATPENYKAWLNNAFDFVREHNTEAEQVVFINAWNEWAEGTYLEPDRRYGYAYLHATANVIREHYNMPDLEKVIKHNNHFTKASNTAIVIHLYYPELADDLLNYIDASSQVDYFINLPAHIDSEVVQKFCTSKRNTYISISPNKGRDILPFIATLEQVTSLGYDYLLKVHSKKTMYRKDGAAIRENLFYELMGKLSIAEIIQHFEKNMQLGLIAPTGSIVALSNNSYQENNVYLKNNLENVKALLARSGHADASLEFDFIAGSMFWARVQAIKPILDLKLSNADFEAELGQTDGTMAHAVERLFSFIAAKSGYQTIALNALESQ
jgi:lipopolysaccharide biosynthesis protein/LmbE family N-acetylglucosaminyl deacetylase/GT2 family glycosyltransferase